MQETQEMQVQSLGGEDSLEEEVAPHSHVLAWKFQGQRSLVGYGTWGHKYLVPKCQTPQSNWVPT